MILDARKVEYELIDITAPGNEQHKRFMMENGKKGPNDSPPKPPQLFFDEDLLGVIFYNV